MEEVVRPKAGLRLRKVGGQYMIVEAGAGHINLSSVYSLNRTAALLWERLSEEGACTPRELADRLCSAFGVDGETAARDVVRQLAEWREYGLVECRTS